MTRGTALFALPRNSPSPHAAGMHLLLGHPLVLAARHPKSPAGRRIVPLPGFVIDLLTDHQRRYPPGVAGLVFTSRSGAAVRRTTFRAKVWRPSLVRAGLLGKIVEVGERKIVAHWHDGQGRECSKQFPTVRKRRTISSSTPTEGSGFMISATHMPPGLSRPVYRSTTVRGHGP